MASEPEPPAPRALFPTAAAGAGAATAAGGACADVLPDDDDDPPPSRPNKKDPFVVDAPPEVPTEFLLGPPPMPPAPNAAAGILSNRCPHCCYLPHCRYLPHLRYWYQITPHRVPLTPYRSGLALDLALGLALVRVRALAFPRWPRVRCRPPPGGTLPPPTEQGESGTLLVTVEQKTGTLLLVVGQ